MRRKLQFLYLFEIGAKVDIRLSCIAYVKHAGNKDNECNCKHNGRKNTTHSLRSLQSCNGIFSSVRAMRIVVITYRMNIAAITDGLMLEMKLFLW